ncbi:MAG: hypothetical protein CMP51_05650 [Flavobacteriales bacterium]|nr:hypothetical protein [Flavobacteriales bacterium]
MKKLILIASVIAFTCVFQSYSQKNVCGTYDGYLHDEMIKYPEFYHSIEQQNISLEKQNNLLRQSLSEFKTDGERKIIPVVVHIIHDFGSENVTDADVHYALDQLNKNINRQADNMLSTPDVFAAVAGSANVEFRLAKIDPDDQPTNGIIRIQSELTDIPENDAGNQIVKTLSYWNSYSYFNIWVVSSFLPQSDGNTLLGYAQFPWSGSMSTDGVAILASEFKNGRTLTHECGHWLGLRHVWGDALCGDDNVYDTPVSKEENWGVPVSAFPYNLNVCVADSINPAGEMFMNYMDYSDDAVMSLFTEGQVAIMNETLETDAQGDIGFRRYIWSDENIANTGTGDGFIPSSCQKEAEFFEQYGNTTNCLGDLTALKGNKNIFPNSTISWDFGDGNTSNGDNTPQHTYSIPGQYDVSINITYNDNVVAKAYDMNDIQAGYDDLQTVVETKIIEGTMSELDAVNASNIELVLDVGDFSIDLDTLFYRGEYQETYYLATYNNSCTATKTKLNYITILPEISNNTNDSYTYSFEQLGIADDDAFVVIENGLVTDWDFNISSNPNWERVSGISSDGSSSMMLNGQALSSANPIIFETQSFNLSDLNEPAISFDYIGAALSSFPTNYMKISYSKECGIWKELATISPELLASAGYYSQVFKPQDIIWNDTVMYDRIGSNDLKSNNVRFKFEYFVSGSSNRLYIDNIRIGESSDLISSVYSMQNKMTVYPNPTNYQSDLYIDLDNKQFVDISIINVLGSKIASVFSGEKSKGFHQIPLDLKNLDKGIYFISLSSADNGTSTIRLLIE